MVAFVYERRLHVPVDDKDLAAEVESQTPREVESVGIGAARHLKVEGGNRRRKAERRGDAHGERGKPLGIRESRRYDCDYPVCADCARRFRREVCERLAGADCSGDALYHDLGNGNHIRMSSRFGIFVLSQEWQMS